MMQSAMEHPEVPTVATPDPAVMAQAVLTLQQQVEQLGAALHARLAVDPVAGAPAQRLKYPKPPETNGKKPTPENWVHKMETYLEANGANLNNPDVVKSAAAYLTDAALNWYLIVGAEVASGVRAPFANWQEFKEAFIERFTPIEPAKDAREKLGKLKQTASVFKYAAEYNELMLLLPKMDEGDRIHWFIEGLKPSVRIHVKLQSPTKLSKAIELAIQADSSVWSVKHNSYSSYGNGASAGDGATPMDLGGVSKDPLPDKEESPRVICYWCGEIGHTQWSCEIKKKAMKARHAHHHP